MIALITAFSRQLALLWLLFLPYCINAKITTAVLIYDSTEVYSGNQVKFSLEVSNHRDKIFKSANEYSKYNFDDFEVIVPGYLHPITKNSSYLWFTIPIDHPFDELTITLVSKKDSSILFNIPIPIVDYTKEIVSIYLSITREFLQNGDTIPIELVAEMNDGSAIFIGNKGKIKRSDFKYTVLRGGHFVELGKTVLVEDTSLCEPKLSIEVVLISNKNIRINSTTEIKPHERQTVDFTGVNGLDGTIGPYGEEGASGGLFRGIDGNHGGHGTDGSKGIDGKNGSSIYVKISIVKHPCKEDSLLKIICTDQETSEVKIVYIQKDTELIEINADGGTGGMGGQGTNGGHGGDSRFYLNSENKSSGNGGDGGDGGNGGDGGYGGDGGNVVIYYDSSILPFIDQLIITANGGYHGRGGNGGLNGRGGDSGNGDLNTGAQGRDGRRSYQGRDGIKGRDGTITYVKV